MSKRPVSLTIIAWYLTVAGILSLVMSVVFYFVPVFKEVIAKIPIPTPLYYALLYLGAIVSITSGVGILKRQNWARFLYVVWATIGFLISLIFLPTKLSLIPSVIVFLVLVYFLFRAEATKYFTETDIEAARVPESQ